MLECRQLWVGRVIMHQCSHCLLRTQGRQRSNFFRCAAESGALQQMGSGIGVPLAGSDGLKVILPGQRAAPLAVGCKAQAGQ